MPTPPPSALYACLLASAIGLASAPTRAQDASRIQTFFQNASGVCKSALPVFASQLRKRPLALQNEGTASAFVNCSLMSTDRSVDGVDAVVVTADNNTAAPIDITCTLVTGLSKMGTPQFFPQTITMPPNSGGLTNEFVWSPTLNDGKPFDNFSINLSCNLPVGAGIGITTSQFDQGVGM